ncbi:MAG: hypothetical protein IJC76_04480 [Lachnospiraceae bacterium]|nr:hypothetical protein [Lachnospiraceae bacterium]
MKKIIRLVFGLVTLAIMCTGCNSKEELNNNKVISDKTTECNWFDSDNIDDSYKLDKISFSKDNKYALLSYATMKMGAELDEYYTFYYAKLKGDTYTIPQEVKFDSDYYAISAQITYSGDKVVFTGISAEQAKTVEGFNNGCNLYIGNFKNGKVSNVKQLDFKEKGLRYYIISLLEDDSIIYNTYDANTSKFTSKIALNNNGEYSVKELDLDKLNDYYSKTTYVLNDKAFIWIADETDKSFKAYVAKYSEGSFEEFSSISPEFMNSKDYGKFYSAVGMDRDGGIYIHETVSNGIKLYRCKVQNFTK